MNDTKDLTDLTRARRMLDGGEYTCVLCRGAEVYTSTRRGVAPLVAWIEGEVCLRDFCAADKVVGRATAFLYVLLGVKAVYARVISRPARQVLETHHVTVLYDESVDHIINRQGDGLCPFEAAVMAVDDPAAAYDAIRRKMREMGIQ